MKQYFSLVTEDTHAECAPLLDINVLNEAFAKAPVILKSEITDFWAVAMPPPSPSRIKAAEGDVPLLRPLQAPKRLRSRSTSNSGSPTGSGSGGTNNSNATPGQIATMKTLFKTNFDKFGGSSWKLATGTVFDDRLREKIESLSYESTLHSFIIEDVYTILETFDNAAEKHELKSAMVDLEGKGLPSPTSGELKFLQQYSLPPNELVDFLATRGWRSVAQTLKKKPAEDFQRVAHSCINHVLEAYEENGFAFPQNTSESWFNIHLWGFLRRALSFPGILEYKTGEVASDASSHRRNKQRDLENRQFTGHKVDGMAVIAKRMLEIMYMEASKKDGGINSTKSLHDTRKLLKLVKDAHDDIRMKTFENVRDRVVTYGLRISGPTATVFSLHQRTGRFYQVVKEDVMSFPPIWKDEDDTEVIIAIIARILSLRKAVLAMAMSVTKWTKLPMEKRIAGHHDDWIAPAMTTPQLLPATFDPVEAMPPLALS